jgi:hypothetical protein
MLLNMNQQKICRIAVLLYNWWDECNKVQEGDWLRDAPSVVLSIEKYADEIIKVHAKKKECRRKPVARWETPQAWVLKINCDGSFDQATITGGWGFVIQDYDGDVCAGCGKSDFSLNPFPMELQACTKSLQVASQLGMRHAILETDAVMVKYANLSSDYDLSVNGGLVVKLKDIFFRKLASADVSHTSWDCNQEAGALAKLGSECPAEDNPNLDTMPVCILALVATDSAPPIG